MSQSFVHLHNHSEYSLLDGANQIPDLVARAKENDMPAIAITDHGVMFGVMEFYFECVKQGIKPILGMEAYMAPKGLENKDGREANHSYHLLLLAKNMQGYRNLCKLHTVAALKGFYYKPRIDYELLQQHSEGLICTTTCLGSEVNQALLNNDYQEALKIAANYREIFGTENYFVELQDHGLPEQHQCNEGLLKIAKDLKLDIIATNDAHYLCRESAPAHDVLLCIGTGALIADEKRLKFQTNEFYIKSAKEMSELFKGTPEAIENTLKVADMCNVELGKQRAEMPVPDLPEGIDSPQYLRELAEKGLKERVKNLDQQGWDRLEYELGVISKTGFEDYFLLVREFAQFTRNEGIAFGVRGSAAGCLVSYCIGITDVDPLMYDLTFERFLNIERISMPDIDMDFEDARRDEVIKYVTEKYTAERVAQIVTFGTLGAKAAIKDAGRVLGYTPQETDKICKTIPNIVGMSIAKAKKELADFRQVVASDTRFANLIEVAESIEGTCRHAGVHAAGVVISKDPLSDYLPLYRGNEGQPITAYDMGILEKIGLLKMDFLGLSNLTVLARAVENIHRTHKGKDPKKHPILTTAINEIELTDKKTYDMLARGDTVGVFQLESGGMRRNIIELKPESVLELSAMVALYRPGPMEHIPTFIDTKFGRKKPIYVVEQMHSILEETYGVIVYQDQVLKIVQALANFTLGKADVLRRAMGKKDRQAMDEMYVEFKAGCEENSISERHANEVWELLLPFAGYAFNKAHAVCYALISYQTAYLKANYPTEYMAALLEVYRSKEDRVTAFVEECRRQKIAVLPPNVNRSTAGFTIESEVPKGCIGAIRFGLAAIKGVGEGIVQQIIFQRESKEGSFTHLYEFCERLKPFGLNKTAVESLIKAGSFDTIEKNRAKLTNVLDGALIFAENQSRNREAGQDSLFGEASGEEAMSYPVLPEIKAISRTQMLTEEKEVMGIYVSDHPLRGLERPLRDAVTHQSGLVSEMDDGQRVTIGGVVTALRFITTKKGDRMANLTIEDFGGQAQCYIAPATLSKMGDLVKKDAVIIAKGVVSVRQRFGTQETTTELRIETVTPFLYDEKHIETDMNDIGGTLVVKLQAAKSEELIEFKKILESSKGDFRVVLEIFTGERNDVHELVQRIDGSDLMIERIEKCLSRCTVERVESMNLYGDFAGTSQEEEDEEVVSVEKEAS